ncbi:hypothetical protein BH20ACT9_BH20ACT9_07750 [soil metagenome]
MWFEDHAGDEVGRYVVTTFDGGPPRALAPEVAPGWSAGLSVREGRLAVGTADRGGFAIHAGERSGTHRVYQHRQQASVGGLSRDGGLLAISHTEHGDALHPDVRRHPRRAAPAVPRPLSADPRRAGGGAPADRHGPQRHPLPQAPGRQLRAGALAGRRVPHRYDVCDASHGTYMVEELVRQQALALDFVAEHLGTPPARR